MNFLCHCEVNFSSIGHFPRIGLSGNLEYVSNKLNLEGTVSLDTYFHG